MIRKSDYLYLKTITKNYTYIIGILNRMTFLKKIAMAFNVKSARKL